MVSFRNGIRQREGMCRRYYCSMHFLRQRTKGKKLRENTRAMKTGCTPVIRKPVHGSIREERTAQRWRYCKPRSRSHAAGLWSRLAAIVRRLWDQARETPHSLIVSYHESTHDAINRTVRSISCASHSNPSKLHKAQAESSKANSWQYRFTTNKGCAFFSRAFK